jgi:hypothetical protein
MKCPWRQWASYEKDVREDRKKVKDGCNGVKNISIYRKGGWYLYISFVRTEARTYSIYKAQGYKALKTTQYEHDYDQERLLLWMPLPFISQVQSADWMNIQLRL